MYGGLCNNDGDTEKSVAQKLTFAQVFVKTATVVISCRCFADDGIEFNSARAARTIEQCSRVRAARAARLFFLVHPIKFFICCVVVDVVTDESSLFFFCYRAIEIVCSFACLITSELTNRRRLKALFTCSLLSSAVSS